ncbi:unnamed protein product [Chrysodeixis includens]|uniref:Uncharacterized protein n=1 Tax=Chrysodeixis includens TaxID=689277 RepID=A0A9N8KVU6_CHRIL|nr:unnamed protein product [Chrysodeixis includens]
MALPLTFTQHIPDAFSDYQKRALTAPPTVYIPTINTPTPSSTSRASTDRAPDRSTYQLLTLPGGRAGAAAHHAAHLDVFRHRASTDRALDRSIYQLVNCYLVSWLALPLTTQHILDAFFPTSRASTDRASTGSTYQLLSGTWWSGWRCRSPRSTSRRFPDIARESTDRAPPTGST